MERKLIINHNDKQELTLSEFKQKFSKELNTAIEIYTRDCNKKDIIRQPFIPVNNNCKADFYSNLQVNFNFNTISNWYIEKIQ